MANLLADYKLGYVQRLVPFPVYRDHLSPRPPSELDSVWQCTGCRLGDGLVGVGGCHPHRYRSKLHHEKCHSILFGRELTAQFFAGKILSGLALEKTLLLVLRFVIFRFRLIPVRLPQQSPQSFLWIFLNNKLFGVRTWFIFLFFLLLTLHSSYNGISDKECSHRDSNPDGRVSKADRVQGGRVYRFHHGSTNPSAGAVGGYNPLTAPAWSGPLGTALNLFSFILLWVSLDQRSKIADSSFNDSTILLSQRHWILNKGS